MPTFDEPSHPMLRVYADIGTITKGIENLEKGQERVEEEIITLQGHVANLVTKEECESRHPRSKYKPTTESKKVGGLLQRVAENAGNITKILTLIASVGIGLWAIHKFSTRLEATLERAEVKSEKTREIVEKIEKRPPPRVIYVPVPVSSDAGAPSPRRRRVTPR